MKIGRYEVVRRLGTGGMGEVLLARLAGEAGFVTWFALKRLKPDSSTGRRSESDLIREARIGGLLNHANVVRIHELLRVDGEFVLVMEYVDGVDLERVLDLHWQRQRPFPPEIAVDVAVQVAEGLHHAHTLVDPEGNPHPLIHRDLKPANVRLSRGGVVKVIDFGIARDRGATSRTAVGLLKGTVRYMSPEQAEGSDRLGTATDIWSAGAILFEMLALKPLHPDLPMAELVDRVQAGKVDDRLALLPPLPERLRGLVERCLSVRPEDRFASALDLSEALRACRGELPPGESLARFSERVDREVQEWDRQTAAGEGRGDPGGEVPADSVINPPTAVGLRLADLVAGAQPGPRAVQSLTGVMSRDGSTPPIQPHAPTVIVQNPRGGGARGGEGGAPPSRAAARSAAPAPGVGTPKTGAAGAGSPGADPWRDDEFGPQSIGAPAVRDDVDTAPEVRSRDILGKRPSGGRSRAPVPPRPAPGPGGGGPIPAAWGALPAFGPGSAGAPAPTRSPAPSLPPQTSPRSADPSPPPAPPRAGPPAARLDTGEWEEPLDLPGLGRGRGRAAAMVGAAVLALAVMVWAVFFRTPAGPPPAPGLPPASPEGEEAQGPVDGGGDGGASGDPRRGIRAGDAPPASDGPLAGRGVRSEEGRHTVLAPVGMGAAEPSRDPPPAHGDPPVAAEGPDAGSRRGPEPVADRSAERRPGPAASGPLPASDPARTPPRILHDPQRSAVIGGSPLAFSVTVPGRTGCEVEVIYRVAGGPTTPLRLVPAGGGEYWGSLKVTAAMEDGLSYFVRVRGCGEGSSGSLANPYRVQVL